MSDHYERAEARERAEDAMEDLRADAERLRALIKKAEWNGAAVGPKSYSCPWCEASFAPADEMAKHIDCPAFTASGEVR